MSANSRFSDFGIWVKLELVKQGKTQTWLAGKVGIKKQYLYKILTDERSGSKYKEAIKKILGKEAA